LPYIARRGKFFGSCGSSSGVEHQPPTLRVAGSNPVFRLFIPNRARISGAVFSCGSAKILKLGAMSPPISSPVRIAPRPMEVREAPPLLASLFLFAFSLFWLVAPSAFVNHWPTDYNFWPQTLACLALGAVALLACVSGARFRLEPIGLCLLAFLGWNTVATLTGIYRHDAWLELSRLCASVFAFFAGRALLSKAQWPLLAIVAGACYPATKAILDFFSTHNTRQFGDFLNPNLFAALLAPCLVLSLSVPMLLFRRTRSAPLAIAGFAPFLLLALGLALTSSKGGFVAAVVALGVFALAMVRAKGAVVGNVLKKAWPVLLVFALVLGAAGTKTVGPRLLRANGADSNSTGFRVYVWRSTLSMARARPLVGFGPGSFPTIYPRFAIAGYTRTAHQSWLQTASEGGFPALVLLWGALVLGARSGWRKLRSANWQEAALGLSALAAIFIHGFFDAPLSVLAVLALLCFCLALCSPDETEESAHKRGLSFPFLGATLVLLLAGYGTQRAALGEDGRTAIETALQNYRALPLNPLGDALASDEGSARLWNFKGKILSLEERERWEGAFTMAMALQPDNGAHPRDYARRLSQLPAPTGADLKRIEELYDRAVSLDPLNSGLRIERGKWLVDHKIGRGWDDFEFVVREWDTPYALFPALGRDLDINLDFARATLALAPRLRQTGQTARLRALTARALKDCADAQQLKTKNAAMFAALDGKSSLGHYEDLDTLESGLRALQ